MLRLNCMNNHKLGEDISLADLTTNDAFGDAQPTYKHKPHNGILRYCLCCATTSFICGTFWWTANKSSATSKEDGKIAYLC